MIVAASGAGAPSTIFKSLVPSLYEPIYNLLIENGASEKVAHIGSEAVLGSWVVCLLLIGLALIGRVGLKKAMNREGMTKYHADSGFSFRNIFELYTGFIHKLSADNLGKGETRKLFAVFGGLFIYIFFSNMIGVLPGGVPPTQSISNNLAMSIFILFLFFGVGLIKQGIGYITHMAGPVLALAVLIFPIELFGALIVRPASLSIRLTGNINGDHAVLGVAYDLSEQFLGIDIGLPIAALGLGTFVSFIQAFVFTLLSIVYVVLSMPHDDDHH